MTRNFTPINERDREVGRQVDGECLKSLGSGSSCFHGKGKFHMSPKLPPSCDDTSEGLGRKSSRGKFIAIPAREVLS